MAKRNLQALVWTGIVLLLVVTVWFGLKALRSAKPAEAGQAGGGRPPAVVIVRPVAERAVARTLSATGTLRAVRRAEVAARESAAVDEITVEEGDLVEAGAVLARLDPRRLEAQIQEGRAALTAAGAELTQREAEHERALRDEEMMRGLWDQRAVAEREYLDSLREMKVAAARENAAREAIEAARKRLELLEVRLADLDVLAPFDGRVVARHSELGEWLSEGAPVVTLVSTGEAEAWLQLPERHVAELRKASPEEVEIRVSGSKVPLRADRLSLIPDVDGRSRRFILVAHLPDPEHLLTPGTSVEATVPIGAPTPHLVVSSDAVLKSYAGHYVFIPEVPEGGGEGPPMAKRVDVDVLFERNGESFLGEGELKVGDQVVIEGNERLFPNSPIDPRPEEPARGEEPGGNAATPGGGR